MAKMMMVNPKKRRKTPAKRKAGKSVAKRRRRNPIRTAGAINQIQNAAVGAAGALGVDVVMAKMPLPIAMTATPAMRAATQGVVSLALGMLVANFGKKRVLGRQIAEGGLTVALHGVGKGLIGPQLGLSAYGGNLLAYQDMDDYSSIDAYTNGGMDAWTSPAPIAGDDVDMENDDYDDFDDDLL